MTIPRKLKIVLLVGFVGFVGPEAANTLAGTELVQHYLSCRSSCGASLTPVSVAGVARRTTRRCAAGVYNC